MCVKCFTVAGWRNLNPNRPAVLETEASFDYKGISIRVRRLKTGHCEWFARTSWNEIWHSASETLRNRNSDPHFKFALRRACHKLGVRY